MYKRFFIGFLFIFISIHLVETSFAATDRDIFQGLYPQFRLIKSFSLSVIPCDNETSELLNMHSQNNKARLSFLNTFVRLPLREERIPDLKRIKSDRKYANSLGWIDIFVCTSGTSDMLAYSARLEAGSVGYGLIYNDSFGGLGRSYISNIKDNMSDAIKSSIEGFAIIFFKARGEI